MHWINWIIFGISVIILAAGILGVVYQIFGGLNRTGLNDKYIWGLNIQGFFTLSTYGIGILTVVSGCILLDFSGFRPVLESASSLAFGCLISSQVLLAADLGRPFRALYIITGRNFVSPLTWDFISLMLLTVFSFVFMFGIIPDGLWIKLWAIATLLFSLVSIAVHTLFFISRAEAGYNSQPFAAQKIFACCLWSGGAILVILSSGIPGHQIFTRFMLICSLIMLITSAGVFIGGELGGKDHKNIKFLVLCTLIFLLSAGELVLFKETVYVELVIAVLILAAVFIEKYEYITEIQKKPTLPMPYSKFEKTPPYRPTVIEWGSLAAGFSMSVVLFYAVIILKEYILPWIFHVIA